MDDLTIARLCAEAMNIEIYIDCLYQYDPIRDDAQAMQLVKTLRVTCMAAPMAGWIIHAGEDDTYTQVTGTDLNRAICECVAKMQLARSNLEPTPSPAP